jgi:hypothetical protein
VEVLKDSFEGNFQAEAKNPEKNLEIMNSVQ